MQIAFGLTEIHKAILVTIHLCPREKIRPEALPKAAGALIATNYQYLNLFRAYMGESIGTVDQATIDKSVSQLMSLELLENRAIKRWTSYLIPERSIKRPWNSKGTAYVGYDGEDIYLGLTQEGSRIAAALLEGRRADLRSPKTLRTTIFIASAFGRSELDNLFEHELRPACEAVGCTAFRVDLSEPEQTITDRVFQAIRECRCMIADLTFARPSVYFEIGVAYGMGIPLILTCRDDHYRGSADRGRVHFDLEQFKISYWKLRRDGRFSWPRRMRPSERLAAFFS